MAANRDMNLDILVSLKDRVSGSLNKLKSNLERAGDAMRKIGAATAVISAISFVGPLNEAAAFQQQLLDIAGTAELTGASAFKFVDEAKTKYEAMALEIGQTSETIAAGAGKMIAAGLDVKDVHASLKDIGEAATAANAQFDDMAGVATSMMQNLKVPAADVRDALGALVAAGKLGSFELKDMAREFPNLTSQVSKFGVTGREAVNFLGSGLQVAMKGAADTSIAANNFSNFLAKALAPRTVKNFSELGVDIEKVMKDAATKGINPLEAMLSKVRQITGVSQKEIDAYMAKAKANGLTGAEALSYVRNELEKIGAAGKISEIFGDQQVLDFVVPALANVDTFKAIKEQVASATGAMTDADFETQMKGLNVQKRMLSEIGTQFSREWGLAFGTWLPVINSGLQTLLKNFRNMDAASGGWLKKALGIGAGFVLLATALGAVGFVLPLITAGFSALAGAAGLLFSPFGAIIALLAGAGMLIWKNWDAIGPKLTKFWSKLKDTAGNAWNSIKQKAKSAFSSINWNNVGVKALEIYEKVLRGLGEAFKFLGKIWEGFAPSLGKISTNLMSAFGSLGGTWENIKGIAGGLMDLANSLLKFMGIDVSSGGFGETIGKILGFLVELSSEGVKIAAGVLQTITGGIRAIVDIMNGQTPDWESFFPEWVVNRIHDIASFLEPVKNAIEWFNQQSKAQSSPSAASEDGVITIDELIAQQAAERDARPKALDWGWLKVEKGSIADRLFGLSKDDEPVATLNDRVKADMADHSEKQGGALPPPPVQKIDLGAQRVDVNVHVEGGGTATANVTQTQAPSVSSDGGLAVGRN
ncbi:phage tail tape measure protein [Bartonella apis]|uniref:phage tail tape measure protein n=1 Tax=Bartonella apis TaxID=1686310 RepID=UPI00242C8ED2|nr:phage tail tape measure protein [Bartonella apis]